MALEYAGASLCQVLCDMKVIPLRLSRAARTRLAGADFPFLDLAGLDQPPRSRATDM